MTDKDNSQTGEYSYTYSYSYSKEGGEKNVEVHTGGSSAAAAGEAAVDSTGRTTAGESSSGKSATGKTTTIKSTTGKTTTRSRSTTTSSRSSTSPRSKNDNSGPDVGYWIMTAIFFVTGLWPVGLIMLISKLSDPKRRKTAAKTASTTTRKASAAIQKATQTPQYSAKSAKWMKIAGILLTIVGAVAFFNGVADNLFWLEDGFQLRYVKYFLEGLFYPTGLLAGGIGLLIGSGSMTRRHRRYASYLRIAGKRSSISVASLARAAEVSERRRSGICRPCWKRACGARRPIWIWAGGCCSAAMRRRRIRNGRSGSARLRRCRRRRRRATPGCSAASAAPTTASQTRS